MSRPVIRISEWALGELRRRSAEEGRTVVSVIDRLLQKPVALTLSESAGVVDEVGEVTPEVFAALEALICKRCGHGKSKHWAKGCLAGCMCNERKFKGPA